jgi:predicted nucleotidyltransferase
MGRFATNTVDVQPHAVQPKDDPSLVTSEKVISAVERIVKLANPLKVIAFGSRARGDHRRDSDLDLAVIVEKFDPAVDQRPIWRADIDVWMSIDMLVFERARHEFMRDSIISVHRDIAEEGVTLYDSSVGSVDLRAIERITR